MFDTFFMILKKSMIVIVFVMLGLATVYTPIPRDNGEFHNVEYAEAGASVVVEIGTNLVQNTYTAIQTTIQTVYKAWIYLKENVLDGIAWVIAKQFISNMVADIVDWINSGFEGNPAFVQDLDNFLLRSADEAVGQFINELGGLGSFVCSPFRLDVQLAVAYQYDLDREDRQVECTLTDVIDNFEDFIDGDFTAGGWAGWFDLVSEPGSTPYGAIGTARTEARARILNAEGEELNLLDFGSGFISIPFCRDTVGPDGPEEICSIVKPGDVVRDTLNESLAAGQDSLVEADEFNEIIVSLLGQLSTRVMEGAQGLLGLSGGSSYTPYSRGSFVDDLRDGTIDGEASGGTDASDSGDSTVGGVSSGLALLLEARNTQDAILAALNVYINSPDPNQGLRAFRDNTENGDVERATADIFLDDARILRTRVTADRPLIDPLIAEYEALDAAYVDATAAERAAIRDRQAAILDEFNSIGFASEAEFQTQADLWDRLLDRNIDPRPPVFDPCDFRDPDCIR